MERRRTGTIGGVVLERTDGEEERLARGETETEYLPIHCGSNLIICVQSGLVRR
jgi:hypothetical protein